MEFFTDLWRVRESAGQTGLGPDGPGIGDRLGDVRQRLPARPSSPCGPLSRNRPTATTRSPGEGCGGRRRQRRLLEQGSDPLPRRHASGALRPCAGRGRRWRHARGAVADQQERGGRGRPAMPRSSGRCAREDEPGKARARADRRGEAPAALAARARAAAGGGSPVDEPSLIRSGTTVTGSRRVGQGLGEEGAALRQPTRTSPAARARGSLGRARRPSRGRPRRRGSRGSACRPCQWLVPSERVILLQTLYLPDGLRMGRRLTSSKVAAS